MPPATLPTSRRLAAAGLTLLLHAGVVFALVQTSHVEPQPLSVAPPVMVQFLAPEPTPVAPPIEPVVQPEPPKPRPEPPKPKPVKKKTPPLVLAKATTAPSANAPKVAPKPTSSVAKTAPAKAAPVAAPVQAPRADLDYLNNRAPTYPSMSRKLKEQGTVQIRVRTDASGKVLEIRLEQSSGYARLDEAALRAVRNWQFTAVAGEAILPVEFTLR